MAHLNDSYGHQGWRSCLLLLLIFVSQGVISQAEGGDHDLTTMAILDFQIDRVSRQTATNVCDSLNRYLGESGELRLWSRSKVAEATASIVGEQDDSWICDDPDCAVRVGRELGANTVLVGSVHRFGKLITIEAQAVDVNSRAVAAGWASESLTGEDGIPEAVRDLAGKIIADRRKLPRGDISYSQRKAASAQQLVLEDFEMSFSLEAGLGLSGHESARKVCDIGDTTICWETTATLRWQAEIGLYGRIKESQWALGLRVGAASAKTTWTTTYQTPYFTDYAEGKDTGYRFHVYPHLGIVLHETDSARAIAFGGAGYRSFTDQSLVSKSFVAGGLSVRVLPMRLNLTYWHGLKSESILKDMLTINLGLGVGF